MDYCEYETDFLSADEEFELRYADEMEVLHEMQQDDTLRDQEFPNALRPTSKKSLNFDPQPMNNGSSLTSSIPHENGKRENILSEELSPLPLVNVDVDKPSSTRANGERLSYQEPSCSYYNKRSVQDVFGDIDDIDFESSELDSHYLESKSKRARVEIPSKTDETKTKDMLAISRILEKRREIQTTRNHTPNLSSSGIPEMENAEITLTRRVPKYAFVTLRNGKNEKFYARLHSDQVLNNKIVSVSEASKTFRLLAVPFENILTEANIILDKKFSQIESAPKNDHKVVTQLKSDVSELWVQKYKPSSYLDLLSDESTNRTLLKWMKLWDKVVFGREAKVSSKSKFESEELRFTKKNYLELDEELDDSGLPKFKIVLLCGPPGLGKTTLAHLIAQHAGYNPVEMNASDDRSPDIFKQQLEAATQMKAVIGKNPKPNCLIIDEIDGAPAPSIEVLIKFAKGELKAKGKKKSGNNVGKLRRPIICICNDVYVPALRSLRQLAFVIHFPLTSVARLTSRLIEIARTENITTDSGAMMRLCEKANNDIRTCLSTMYCLKDQPIRLSTIHKVDVGNKDMQKGLFSVWQDIFQLPNQNTKNIEDAELRKKCKTETEYIMLKRMQIILKSVQGNGDYDRLAQGVYENFLSIKISDGSMKNVSKGLSWFCFLDKLKTHVVKSQMYTLLSYLPFAFVAWAFLFSNYQRSKISYPSMMYELISRRTKYFESVQEILKCMEPKIRAYCHHEQLLLDTLPLFVFILNPELRAVNIQLFTSSERESLRQLVSIMIDYNLNFIQERTQSGSYEFNIDPNIDEVVEFPDMPRSKHLTYSLKMMISREIEQEKLRRLECSMHKVGTKNDNFSSIPQCDELISGMPNMFDEILTEAEPPKSQNHLQKLTPKIIKESTVTCSVYKDFFGRIIQQPQKKSVAVKVDEIVKSDVWFHFKEGFSNAVRRSVYIKDLLQ